VQKSKGKSEIQSIRERRVHFSTHATHSPAGRAALLGISPLRHWGTEEKAFDFQSSFGESRERIIRFAEASACGFSLLPFAF
jgi:hypothetical protein